MSVGSTIADLGVGLAKRYDNWQNALTGFGTSRDKTSALTFQASGRLLDPDIENLFRYDDMARKVCIELPRASLRQGFTVEIDGDPKGSKAITNVLEALEARDKCKNGAVWGRAYGGAGLFIGADDGRDTALPLNEANIQSVRFLNVIEKRYLIPASWYIDPSQPKFGEPEVFRVYQYTPGQIPTPTNLLIHESRLIIFRGALTSDMVRKTNQGWDDSVLQPCWEVLRMFAGQWQAVSSLMSDASQAVFSIKGLIKAIAEGSWGAVLTRMGIVDMNRSSGRAVLLDADLEKFERVATSFAGLPELVEKCSIRLAAAAEMPMTVLFGVAPQGMNATGAGDIKLWYDQIKSEQQFYLRPRLMRLIKLIFLSKEGPTQGVEPPDWELCFPSLWQLSPTEEAAVNYQQMQTDTGYVLGQIITGEEVSLSPRFAKLGYAIDVDARKALASTDAIAAELGAVKKSPDNNPNVSKPGEEPPPGDDAPPATKAAKS